MKNYNKKTGKYQKMTIEELKNIAKTIRGSGDIHLNSDSLASPAIIKIGSQNQKRSNSEPNGC